MHPQLAKENLMRRASLIGLTIALLTAGCTAMPGSPVAPSPTSNAASSSLGLAHDGLAVGPADGLEGLEVSAPISLVPTDTQHGAPVAHAGAKLSLVPPLTVSSTVGDFSTIAFGGQAATSRDCFGRPGVNIPAPRIDVAVDQSVRSAAITWIPVPFGEQATFWCLYYTAPGTGDVLVFPSGVTTVGPYTLPPGEYIVSVAGGNASGLGAVSERRTFTIGDKVPTAPFNLGYRITNNGRRVELSWDWEQGNGGPVSNYRVFANVLAGGIATTAKQLAPDMDLPAGTYTVWVVAVNASGTSAPSNTVTFTLGEDVTYTGTFDMTGSFSRTGTSCTWRVRFVGTVTVRVSNGSGGPTGETQVDGTWSTPSPSANCNAGNGTYNSTRPLSIVGSGVASAGIAMSLATGSFSGNLIGNVITGTLSAQYNLGTGTASQGVTLR